MSTTDAKAIEKIITREEKQDGKHIKEIQKELAHVEKSETKIAKEADKAVKTHTKLASKEESAAKKLNKATHVHEDASISERRAREAATAKHEEHEKIAQVIPQKKAELERAIQEKQQREHEHELKRNSLSANISPHNNANNAGSFGHNTTSPTTNDAATRPY